MKSTAQWAILPYAVKRIGESYLLGTQWGDWVGLTRGEFSQVHSWSLQEGSALFHKLKARRLVIDQASLPEFISSARNMQANLFFDTGLHIAVVTHKCNFSCVYCQAHNADARDMSLPVAVKVVEYLFSVRNPMVRLELQGGEPLCNWKTVRFLIEFARERNTLERKNLMISLVSNLTLLDKAKARFLAGHHVDVCVSFDGPQQVHDSNRPFLTGKGTYSALLKKLDMLRKVYADAGMYPAISALPTVTRASLPYPREIVDEFVQRGFSTVHLRPINNLGKARRVWSEVGYSAEEYIAFWKEALEHILALNARGIRVTETMTGYLLRRILRKQDHFFVDLTSPCGAARSQMVYAPNGDVYTCDEARMLGEDTFKLGNVRRQTYQEVLKSPAVHYTTQASLMSLWDYNSALCAWSGTCPVLNFQEQGSPVVKITQTFRHKVLSAQLEFLFDKLLHEPQAESIFQEWVASERRQ